MKTNLKITIRNNEEDIAKLYYSWIGTTLKAAEKVKDIMANMPPKAYGNATILYELIHYITKDGGYITEKGAEILKKKYLFTLDGINIKAGKKISSPCMYVHSERDKILKNWMRNDKKSILIIDFDEKSIFFDAYNYYTETTIETIKNKYKIEDSKMLKRIMVTPYDLENIPFDKLDDFVERIKIANNSNVPILRYGELLYGMI